MSKEEANDKNYVLCIAFEQNALLENIFNAEHFSDLKVRLIQTGKTFYVYRGILAAKSVVFKTMFETPMKEETNKEIVIDDGLNEEDMDKELLFELLLKTIYLSEIEVHYTQIMDYFDILRKYEMTSEFNAAMETMEYVYSKFDFFEQIDFILDHIHSNTPDLFFEMICNELDEYNETHVKQFCTVLQQKDLSIVIQFLTNDQLLSDTKLQILLHWLQVDEMRHSHVNELCNSVTMLHTVNDSLLSEFASKEFCTPECKSMLLSALLKKNELRNGIECHRCVEKSKEEIQSTTAQDAIDMFIPEKSLKLCGIQIYVAKQQQYDYNLKIIEDASANITEESDEEEDIRVVFKQSAKIKTKNSDTYWFTDLNLELKSMRNYSIILQLLVPATIRSTISTRCIVTKNVFQLSETQKVQFKNSSFDEKNTRGIVGQFPAFRFAI